MLKVPTVLEQSGSILSQIGHTPLVRLERIAEDLPGIQTPPGGLEGALRDHGARDHRADRGPADALCRRTRNQRNVRRRDAADAPRSAVGEVLFGAAILRVPRPRRTEAHADLDRARD